MTRRRMGRGLMTAGLLALSACRPPAPSTVAAPVPAHGPVLITIVVDQMAAWLADDRLSQLPADGGFARLRLQGLTTELRYAHAVTDTAPGHSALYTGAVPRASGIFGNEALGADGKPRSILLDEATQLVDARDVVVARPGSSLARLRVQTLADALLAQEPNARVYSFSLKDRGALFAAGRHPTAALWLDVAGESFVTSTAFEAPPAWAAPLADRDAVARVRAAGWTLTDAEKAWVGAHAETPDVAPGEGDLAGLGIAFPHTVGSAKAMRATPLGDRVLFALAHATLDELAAKPRATPTLLALSLSSNDYVNHVFGPQSWEAWAELRELDGRLAGLLADADRALGRDGYAVLLTSDHGGGALPEVSPATAHVACGGPAPDRWERSCDRRRRIAPRDLVAAAEAAVVKEVGPGPWLLGFAEPLLYMTPKGRALSAQARAQVVRTVAETAKAFGIAAVVDARADEGACRGEDIAGLVCNAIDPTGPGDLYLVVAPGAFFDPDVAPGAGTSHGSPYLYDRAVPLLVLAPGRVRAGTTRAAPVPFTAFARTAASLLGIRAPGAAADGEDLAR